MQEPDSTKFLAYKRRAVEIVLGDPTLIDMLELLGHWSSDRCERTTA